MKEKAVCFISENLVILLPKSQIVNNMHEAYHLLDNTSPEVPVASEAPVAPVAPVAPALFDYYGYGTFISGPSKTADIAQVLVMGAQAARSATVILMP
jgi:L-lactate dehydrogenase complex protein LldG